MDINLVGNNFVIVFKNNVNHDVKIDPIKTFIAEVYSDFNPTPVLASFPNVTTVMIPEVQMSIIIDHNKCMVVRQKVGDMSNDERRNFSILVHKICDPIDSDVSAYGYNYVLNIEGEDFDEMVDKVHKNFIKGNIEQFLEEGSKVKFILPSLSYRVEDRTVGITLGTILDINTNEPYKLECKANINFNNDAIPEISKINEELKVYYEVILRLLNSIFE